MTQVNPSRTNLLPPHDPCSASYKSGSTDIAAPQKLGFFRSVKRFFGFKSSRPLSFIMMNGSNKRLNDSTRSRSPASNRNTAVVPTPAVYLTTPSVKRRSHYRVHSFEGAGSPPTRERSRVRFSHPAVSQEILPTIPPSPSLLAVPENDEINETQSNRASGATDISDTSSSPRDSSFPSVRPKDIYLYSAQSVTTDGQRETYSDFKQRLDGHKQRADRPSSQRPPSLSFIPRMGTIRLDEYDSEQFRSSVKAAEAEKHRSDALSRLEGKAPQTTDDSYVLAIMPREHLPITAIQVASDAHPSNLIPGSSSQTRPKLQRPHTFSGATASSQTFQPYSPSGTAKAALAKQRIKMPAVVDEEPADTPMFDTKDTAGFHARHSQHYRRVESCEFEPKSSSRPRPASRPLAQSQSQNQINTASSYLLSPSPPASDDSDESTAIRQAERRNLVVRKPVLVDIAPANTSKALPPTPKPRSSSKSVTIIAMNANGYPNLAPHPSKRFSATATYQQRTRDSVEAKYMKENPSKKSKYEKTEKNTSKKQKHSDEKAKAKAAKKSLKQIRNVSNARK